MRRIALRNRERVIAYTFVDDEDYEEMSKYRWCRDAYGYAQTSVRINGKKRNLKMHRLIVNTPDGKDTDHINRNKLDNRRSNLRICTHQQNSFNLRRPKRTSKYNGVSWDKSREKWYACIQRDGKTLGIGRFIKESDAARAYDNTARQIHGEFACLNFT